jgi:hypothetical protein
MICIIYAMHRLKRNLTPDDLVLVSCGDFLVLCCTFKFTSIHEVVKGFRLIDYATLAIE